MASSESEASLRKPLNVLLATSGSVASIKLPLIARALTQYAHVDVQIVTTRASRHFFDTDAVNSACGKPLRVWVDEDEWTVRRVILD